MLSQIKRWLDSRGIELHGIVIVVLIAALIWVGIATEDKDLRGVCLGWIPLLLVFGAVFRALFPKNGYNH